ncbi:hypothetical protein D3C81_347500 [compost metagenome]|jgi:hypothetical protein
MELNSSYLSFHCQVEASAIDKGRDKGMSELEDSPSAKQRQADEFELVAETIIRLCTSQEKRSADAPTTWVSTRDIAECCNLSIYKARYLLLKMAKKGWVQVTPHPINNALRWYICPDIPVKRQLYDNK